MNNNLLKGFMYIIIIVGIVIGLMIYNNYTYEKGYEFGKRIGEQDGVNYAIKLLTGEMCINNKTFFCNNNQTICGCANIGGDINEMDS